jgi:hypothetical protein
VPSMLESADFSALVIVSAQVDFTETHIFA